MVTKSAEVSDLSGLVPLLGAPTPGGLWQLRNQLLRREVPAAEAIWPLLDQFYHFLNELVANATAREYSHFASLLDIGAVGGVALQNLLTREEGSAIWKRLLAGGLSESLMVMAARQYVKAWEGEMDALYRAAAWNLYGALWAVSEELKPALAPGTRAAHLDDLLAPLQDVDTPGTVKAAFIVRLYQILLLARLQDLANGP